MADIFSKEKRNEVMSKIRSKNTSIETLVFRELRKRGIYFQKHYKGALGTPDIALPRKKVAIFIDGDFWHGYRYPAWKGRLGTFWHNKIERNRRRDKKYHAILRRKGWHVVRIWEHQLKASTRDRTIQKLIGLLSRRS